MKKFGSVVSILDFIRMVIGLPPLGEDTDL